MIQMYASMVPQMCEHHEVEAKQAFRYSYLTNCYDIYKPNIELLVANGPFV